jgi:hypothetical protein
MASRLKKFREYLKETVNTCEKLVPQKPKQEAVILKYVAKQDIIKPANDLIPATPEIINERACILANDMGLPFEWAEAIAKLQAIDKPKNITHSSWLDIQSGCTQLYRNDFRLLKLIINHNWLVSDIYGCHPVVPLARFDCMGLVLLLHQGDEVVGVNKQRIKILKSSGSSVVFSRKLGGTGEIVLLHELTGD